MARVTANVGLPVGELGIDVVNHLDHLAGHEFLGILVARVIALHVAEVALHAERTTHRAHHRSYLLLFEDLEVLMRLRSASSSLLRSILSADGDRRQEQYCG